VESVSGAHLGLGHILGLDHHRVEYYANTAQRPNMDEDQFVPLETRIVEQLIKVVESDWLDNQYHEELFRLLAKYRSRLTYLEKQYRKDKGL